MAVVVLQVSAVATVQVQVPLQVVAVGVVGVVQTVGCLLLNT